MHLLCLAPTLLVVAAMAAAAEPADVGMEKQLFIDSRFIESSENVTLTMNPPQKAGEVIRPEKPWERFATTWYHNVIDTGEGYMMYYLAMPAQGQWVVCLATSKDGIIWEKPDLGVVEFGGSKANNIVLDPALFGTLSDPMGTIFYDPHGTPDARFKGVFSRHWPDPEKAGMYVFTSPDGIHWTVSEERLLPLVPDTANQGMWDARIGKYVLYLRLWNPLRAVGRIEVDDVARPWPYTPAEKPFLIWGEGKVAVPSTEFPTVFGPDEQDPPNSDFYQPAVTQYPWAQDAYFMFPSAYQHFPEPPVGQYGNDGLLDAHMAVSRDGIAWTRIARRPYVGLGLPGQNDAEEIYFGDGMIRDGDWIYQYYGGYQTSHGEPSVENGGSIFRVVQRLDGFVSADFTWEGGTLTTPPMAFTGERLELNLDCSAMGEARVEVRDAEDRPIEGLSLAECNPIHGNHIRTTVTWKGGGDLSTLRGKPIKLHFAMRAAKLYAFQFMPWLK